MSTLPEEEWEFGVAGWLPSPALEDDGPSKYDKDVKKLKDLPHGDWLDCWGWEITREKSKQDDRLLRLSRKWLGAVHRNSEQAKHVPSGGEVLLKENHVWEFRFVLLQPGWPEEPWVRNRRFWTSPPGGFGANLFAKGEAEWPARLPNCDYLIAINGRPSSPKQLAEMIRRLWICRYEESPKPSNRAADKKDTLRARLRDLAAYRLKRAGCRWPDIKAKLKSNQDLQERCGLLVRRYGLQ